MGNPFERLDQFSKEMLCEKTDIAIEDMKDYIEGIVRENIHKDMNGESFDETAFANHFVTANIKLVALQLLGKTLNHEKGYNIIQNMMKSASIEMFLKMTMDEVTPDAELKELAEQHDCETCPSLDSCPQSLKDAVKKAKETIFKNSK